MRKIIFLFLVALGLCAGLSSCANTYRTQSRGLDNVSFVTVLCEGAVHYYAGSVVVTVDGVEYPYDNVRKVKHKIKASRIAIEPGRHRIGVSVDGETVVEEDVFLGLQESKVFVLK
jgi:hypothetical protein